MMKRLTLSFFLLLFLGSALYAQKGEAPADPQVPQPSRIALVKTYTYRKEKSDEELSPEQKKARAFLEQMAPRLLKVEVVKGGEVSKESQRYSNGTSVEVWKWDEYTFKVDPANPQRIGVSSPNMRTGEEPREEASDAAIFSEFSWVNKEAFRGREVRNGAGVLVYQAGDVSAWVDEATRLPLVFRTASMQVNYQYKERPTEDLKLPERFLKRLEAIKRAWRGQQPL